MVRLRLQALLQGGSISLVSFSSSFSLVNMVNIFGFMTDHIDNAGEHTDYNEGFVLPMALPLVTMVVGRCQHHH